MAGNVFADPEFGKDASSASNPFADKNFGKPQGAVSYLASQAKAGLTADLPTIAGKALQYAGATDLGGKMRAYGEANAAQAQPDENQGAVTKLVAGAIRGAAPIVPLAVGGLAANVFAPEVAVPLELAGATGLAAGFGGSQAQDTLEKARAAGIPEEQAVNTARKTGAITGVGMGAVGALTGGMAAPAIRAIAGPVAKTAAESLAASAAPAFARPFVAETAGHLAGNVASMAAANAGTAAVEQQAGLPGPTPGQAALEGVESGASLTAALLPFGLARTALAHKANTAAVNRLQSASTDPEQRAQIAAQIHANLKALDPVAANHFAENVQQSIDLNQPVTLGEHLLKPYESKAAPAAAPPEIPVPNFGTSPGAAAPKDGLDYERQVDTSGLGLVDPQEEARARAASIDYAPADQTPSLTSSPGAAGEPRTGLAMPPAEIDTSGLSLKPSEAMGLDPNAGPISRVAVLAVDSGAHQHVTEQAAQAAAAEAAAKAPKGKNEKTAEPAAQAAAPDTGTVAAGPQAGSDAAGLGLRVSADQTVQPNAPLNVIAQGRAEQANKFPAGKPSVAEDNVTTHTAALRENELDAVHTLSDILPERNALSDVPLRSAMRQIGFTEGEIRDATSAQTSRGTQANGAGDRGAVPPAQGAPQAGAGSGNEAAREAKPAKGLSLGITPGNAEAVSVKDGLIHIGKEPAINFETGEPIKAPADASDAQIKQALKDAGAVSRRQKFYGGQEASTTQAPVAHEPSAAALSAPTNEAGREHNAVAQAPAAAGGAISDTGKGAAVTPVAKEAPSPEPTTPARPANWRSNFMQATQVGKSVGIPYVQGRKLSDLLAMIDAKDKPANLPAVAKPSALKTTTPNVVVRDVRDFDGNKLGDIIEPHDGTKEGILAAAARTGKRLQDEFSHASNSGSRIGATDENGKAAWAVSPNLKNIDRIGTREAAYTWGDLNAAPDKPAEQAKAGTAEKPVEPTKHFQRYTSEQRADLQASHRLMPGQKNKQGEEFWTHPDAPGIAFPTRADALRAAAKAKDSNTPAAAPVEPPSPAKQQAEGKVAQTAAKAPEGATPAARYGRDHVDLAEGGKPFTTRAEAAKAKRLQPMRRVVSVEGGFALADKTEAQLAAEAAVSKRLRIPKTSPQGMPIAAHAFIAAEGGMSKAAMADMGFDRNVRVGNRSLFAAEGGMTLERATEKLKEHGYLPEGAGHTQMAELVKRSLTEPQYTAEGWQHHAEIQRETSFADYQEQQRQAAEHGEPDPFPLPKDIPVADLKAEGYDEAGAKDQADFRALIAQAEAGGLDTESILSDIARVHENSSPAEYLAAARSAVEHAITQGSEDGRRGTAAPAPARESQPAEGLTSPTREDILAKQQRAEDAASAEAAQNKADEQKASADAQRGEFTLTGSDRKADANPNQGDIFSAVKSEPTPAAPAKSGETAKTDAELPAAPEFKPGLAGAEQVARIYLERGLTYEDFSAGFKGFYQSAHEFMGGAHLKTKELRAALAEAGYDDERGSLQRWFNDLTAKVNGTPKDARTIAREIAKARPDDDVATVREAARKAIVEQLGKKALDSMDKGSMMTSDELTQAIHDGQYAALREYAAKMPVPVHESDIPRSAANAAHQGTSFNPERRGASEQRDYLRTMVDAWKRAERATKGDPEALARVTEQMQTLVDGYRSRVLAELGAHSRIMSSMIAGPSKFPVERMRKANATADKRAQEAREFLDKGITRMLKAARAPIDNSPESELARVKANLEQREKAQQQMKAANAALRKGDDAALKALGFSEAQIIEFKKPDFAGRPGFADYKLTNNNAEIRRLRERLKSAEERTTEAAAGPVERTYNGVKIEENATDDRLRLHFDGKPSEEVRTDLKAAAFKWSPNAGAWQRQLTDNARQAAKEVLDKHYPAGEAPSLARGEQASPGLTREQFTSKLSEAFGEKVADRLQKAGVVVPIADQSQLPDHVVPFIRAGDKVMGFYDPKTDRTYAVLSNLTPDIVKGLALHEVGVHYGFSDMLSREKYIQVLNRIKLMGKMGNVQVKAALAEAKKNALAEQQIPEETLAYLVTNHPEMGVVREVIAAIKAFLFKNFGIGGKYLTADDITALAKAAVLHASRTQPGARTPEFARGTNEPMASRKEQAWPDLAEAYARYEKGGDDVRDLHATAEHLLEDDRAPESIRDAAEKLRTELDDEREYGGRNDTGGAEDAFLRAVEKALSPAPDSGGAPSFSTVTPLRKDSPEHRLAALGYRVERNYEDEPGFIEHQDGTQYDWNEQAKRFEDDNGNPLPQKAADLAQYIGNIGDNRENPEALGEASNDRIARHPGDAPQFMRTLDAASATIDKIKDSEAAKFVDTAWDGVKMATAPQYRSPAAMEMARTIIAGMGENEMKSIRFRSKLNAAVADQAKATTLGGKARDLLQKGLTLNADKMFVGKDPKIGDQFMQAMDSSDKTFLDQTPGMRAMADVIRDMWAGKAAEVQKLDTGALQNLREDYFKHMWKREPSADAQREIFTALSKRPLEGSKSFTKERVFEDFNAGIKAGFEPISHNPLDIVALSMAEMDKYILAHKTLNAMEGSNGVHLIAAGEKTPKGFTDVNGRFGSIERQGQKLRYVARDDVAQVINNYLSPSLYHNKYVGKPFTAYMGAANTLNQFQLGVFSAFHAGFTSFEAVISHASIGIKALTAGDFKGAAKYLGSAPAAWINNPKMGSKIIDHMMDSAAHPEMAPILQGLQLAGFKWQMDNRFRTDATKGMLQAWSEGKAVKAGLNAIGAVTEQSARPILEWLVPRQKFGVFGEMYSKWMQDNPNASHEELRNSAQQIWNRVDSRLGQVVYDRLFVHNVAKNFAQMLIRAPGWTGGTILEVGGGLKDLASYAKALATGQKPPSISDRAAYTLSMLMTTAIANATLTALFTGSAPDDWRDLVAFRSGNMDEHGRPERFMLPTYMKDVYAYAKAPGTTLLNKSHPLLSLVGDVARNRDYFGTEVRSEDDNLFTQLAQTAGFTAKAFVPFWVKGVQKEKEREGSALSMAAPLIGVMPAPSGMDKSPAEALMAKYSADRLPQGTRTQEETDKANLRRQMYVALRKGEQDKAREAFEQGKEQGLFGARDYLKVVRQARQDPVVNSFSRLSYEQAQRVMKVASDEEKQELAPAFMKKRIAWQRQHAGMAAE